MADAEPRAHDTGHGSPSKKYEGVSDALPFHLQRVRFCARGLYRL
jgi:hypothetical protein